MDGIRLISAHFAIFLLFMAFKEVTPEIDKVLLNIAPISKNNIDTLKIKSDRFRRNHHNTFRDVNDDHQEDNDIRLQLKRADKTHREPKIWDQWGNWSTCSVTCGIGKIMRWRHCIGGRCSLGEKKAQLKTCTSAAC
ncbi:hypothetical protein P5V15_010530 [Pogonomyrmex californicus]